jgi:hypothetical protein
MPHVSPRPSTWDSIYVRTLQVLNQLRVAVGLGLLCQKLFQ